MVASLIFSFGNIPNAQTREMAL